MMALVCHQCTLYRIGVGGAVGKWRAAGYNLVGLVHLDAATPR